jgi:hypothetical protein
MQKLLLTILVWVCCMPILPAQAFFRFRADFSIKEKISGEAKGQLVTGTLFFDKNSGKINHQVTFPNRSNWLVQDTVLYEMSGDSLLSTQIIPAYSQYSIYRLMLDQQLNDFGLGKAGYTLTEHQQPDSSIVLTTWMPPAKFKDQLGKVVVSSNQKLVDGVAFYDPKQVLIAKFYLKDYVNAEDLPIPSKLIQIIYPGEGKPEYLRIVQFSHIQIDENGSDENYDFKLPLVVRR